MKAFILRFASNTEWHYPTRIDNNILVQTSKTYSTGVIEYQTKQDAQAVSDNLKFYNGKKISGIEIIEVNNN